MSCPAIVGENSIMESTLRHSQHQYLQLQHVMSWNISMAAWQMNPWQPGQDLWAGYTEATTKRTSGFCKWKVRIWLLWLVIGIQVFRRPWSFFKMLKILNYYIKMLGDVGRSCSDINHLRSNFCVFFPVQALATFRQIFVCSKRVKLLNPLFMSIDCELEKKTILIGKYR